MAFMDHLYIIASSAAQARDMLLELHDCLNEVGLRLQTSKCAWMVVSHNTNDVQRRTVG